MNTQKPEFPRPSAGDELLIIRKATRYRPLEVKRVRVGHVARFRIMLKGLDGEDLPWGEREWDIRTRAPWNNTPPAKRTGSGSGVRLHTAETWAWQQRADAANAYMYEQHIFLSGMSGSLATAIRADLIGFVNVLRRFEGLEEI